jgi:hypothetical protein
MINAQSRVFIAADPGTVKLWALLLNATGNFGGLGINGGSLMGVTVIPTDALTSQFVAVLMQGRLRLALAPLNWMRVAKRRSKSTARLTRQQLHQHQPQVFGRAILPACGQRDISALSVCAVARFPLSLVQQTAQRRA